MPCVGGVADGRIEPGQRTDHAVALAVTEGAPAQRYRMPAVTYARRPPLDHEELQSLFEEAWGSRKCGFQPVLERSFTCAARAGITWCPRRRLWRCGAERQSLSQSLWSTSDSVR